MKSSYTCPVCYFDGMDEPPMDHAICDCCGTQFGYSDIVPDRFSQSDAWTWLRDLWVKSGANFYYQEFKPQGWTPNRQLSLLGYWTTLEPQSRPFEVSLPERKPTHRATVSFASAA